MEMTQGEIPEERGEEMLEMREMEKQFLKDLYLFMRKRNTPIERIPNLGFKQIDLFLMFKTVSDLGGYHQVTAQQMWKQVYNVLGGNPRSTSAATCTRRHYEKLLLPYECHVKGVSINSIRHHQLKHFHYPSYDKDDDDGLRPPKRTAFPIPLGQNLLTPQSEPASAFLLPLQYPHYYNPSHAVLPPPIPITSPVLAPHTPAVPQPQYPLDTYPQIPTERYKEPLQHLRHLAERYKTSSGLTEPLNLSVKASRQDINPASSFSPLSSSKNPKFLNKPSPLYTPQAPQVLRSDRCETSDDEAGAADSSSSLPQKPRERKTYVIDVNESSSPTNVAPAAEAADTAAQNSSSPKTDFPARPKDGREETLDLMEVNLREILPSLPQEHRGEMEIEVPLSVFHNWLRLCRSSATMPGDKQPPNMPSLEEQAKQRNFSSTDAIPTNLAIHMNPQHQSFCAEDLRLRRNPLSPAPITQTAVSHPRMGPSPFTSYKPFASGGTVKNVASRDIYPFEQQDCDGSYGGKQSTCCTVYKQESKSHNIQVKPTSNAVTGLQNFVASRPGLEEKVQGEEKAGTSPGSAFLMMNSNTTSPLHLTPEEVMKLKKIISSAL